MSLRYVKQHLYEAGLKRFYTSITCLYAREEKNCKESKKKTRDHMIRTENSPRQTILCDAKVVNIENISSSVKGLQLFLSHEHRYNAEFKAGQWVDMIIPGVTTVGGFSICNAPKDLEDKGILELAVKFSDHPPAFWVHNECKLGSQVQIRVGGNFFYKHQPLYNTLLIAGGVGINPLLSIFRHKRDRITELVCPSAKMKEGKTLLIYSAKTSQDLIFKENIKEICNSISAPCHFHVTKERNFDELVFQSAFTSIFHSKISMNDISCLPTQLHPSVTNCYVCGPPAFIERVEEYLLETGYPKKNIFYEKWW